MLWFVESRDIFLKVIVTDWDNAMMNDVETIFPNSIAILCRYDILKNVRSKWQRDQIQRCMENSHGCMWNYSGVWFKENICL